MSRPKIYQAGTVSTWCGLAYRVAQPCEIKDGRPCICWGRTESPCRKEGSRCAAERERERRT